ncbi:hypothetical protein CathTA2_2135 [Caldalkalibacillus thermarum TA2.A1]|uniref:Uncharacterized protein n=1 Tax=Caldalkalibacillus thermarum (strain TA2.A1) TaxID=986075 RepID=F5L8I0_CALTT|nr:hypothetical protein [Caldalkalibacillus thermarum]EGL82319.1 hypothetical protein CathTA2_2135 [Caldalkalibacillus thermarum TA2.A1]QZT32884.1 hypothetical protein HUR95_11080 [Caldalkalibacillus thermarum TA2.A1]
MAGEWVSPLISQFAGSIDHQLVLRPGQVLKGKVIQLLPQQTAWVQLGKFQVLARLEVPLTAGQTEWFQVLDVSRPMTLKVIGNPSINGTGQSSTDHEWQPVLRWLGVDDTAPNRQLLQFFLTHHLPVTRSLFQQVQETLAQVGQGEWQRQAVLMAVQNGWTPTATIVRSVGMFLHQPSLADTLAQLEKMVGDGQRDVLQALLSRLAVHQFSAQQLKHYFQGMSFHISRAKSQGTVSPEYLSALSLPALLQTWLKGEILSQSARNQAENILYQLAGQHLLMQGDGHLPVSYALFQLLVRQHGRTDSVYGELQGYKDQKGKLSSDHCRLLLYVNLQRLGETCVDVYVQNRLITVKLFNDLIRQSWLDSYKPLLQQGLAAQQYKLSSLVAKKWQALRTAPVKAKQGISWGHYQGVDIRI